VSETAAPRGSVRASLEELLDRDWVLALALAFFVGVVVWFGRSVEDFFGGSASDVLVPAFTGQTVDDATGECARLRLSCTIVARQASDEFPRDIVMAQQPASGTQVREGRAVSLVVSNGIRIFPMPDVRFESLRNVNLILGNLKLQLAGAKIVPDDDVPANHVVDQNPPPLASVREGSAVTVTLSKGPPASVKLPDFVGLDVDAARAAAQAAHVPLGQVVWTPFGPAGPARGTVVRQSPAAGQFVDPFAMTSLQVSAGPAEYGYIVRQVHVSAAIPLSDDTADVRMQVRDRTGTWNVYDGYAQGGQKLDLTVTAIGPAELDTYINNELLDSATIGVEAPRPAPQTSSAPRKGPVHR
jgi:beta-lactam-binding protein with PASTA domain